MKCVDRTDGRARRPAEPRLTGDGSPYRRVCRVACALLILAVATPRLAAQVATPTFTNVSVHDPSLVRADGTFYVFGSHLASAKSDDLLHWTQLTRDYPAPGTLVPNPTTEFAEAVSWVGGSFGFWAPDVIRLGDGRYYFYYCVGRLDQPRAALGTAVSDSIAGPYTHRALLLRSGQGGQPPEAGPIYDPTVQPNTIDPAVFFDANGRLWMVYGSYSGGIFILELNRDTGVPLAGQGYGKKLIGGNHARIEGAYILRSPETGFYYLFMSFGGLASTDGYNIRVGRSLFPDGPYVDSAGTNLATVAGAPGTLFDDASIAPHGVKLIGNYQFLHVAGEPGTVSRGYLSPGHNSAYFDPATGKYFVVFHTRFVGRGEQHEVRVHQMFLNEDGWFIAAPHRYAGETLAPTLATQVPGDYKVIVHTKPISAAVNTSWVVTLRADNSISGAASGSWQLADGRFATITLGGVTYRGVFARLWDDDNQTWVRAFTALSDDGVSLWGSKVATATPELDAPQITADPVSQTIAAGGSATFSVTATGDSLTYQWRKDGASISGATNPSLTLANLSVAASASYSVVVANPVAQIVSAPATLLVDTPRRGRLINLSVRTRAGSGSDTLIAGFVLGGSGTKPVMARGIGATLTNFGLTGVLADPMIELYRDSTVLAANDSWSLAPNQAAIHAANGHLLGASPLNATDAVLLSPLGPGPYTAQVKSADGSSGVALLEIYDTDSAAPGTAEFDAQPRLINLSARARVEAGDVLIAGFVINGNVPKRLLIRAAGATLSRFGVSNVLANPTLQLNDGRGAIAQNDNWSTAPNRAALVAAGADRIGDIPLEATDAALVVTLVPGAYTALVRSANGSAGVALIEVFDLDSL